MARTKRSRRSYGAGEWGRNRVRVFPDAKTGLCQIEWRENGRRLTRSLKHRDWRRAKRQADEFAAGFAGPDLNGKAEAEPEPLTLETLFDIYGEEVTPTKGAHTRGHDRAAMHMFLRFFGRNRDPATLSQRDWDRFIWERRAGRIGPSGKRVSDRTVEYDLKFLIAVLNWAAKSRDERGRLLLDSNPLRGLRTPTEKNPTRVVLADEEYRALLEVSRKVDWRFHLALVLAHETGHRIGAIRQLRWSGIDFEGGTILWRAEHDKSGYKHTTPVTTEALDALREVRVMHPATGEAPVMPAPRNLWACMGAALAQGWWDKGERLAGLEPKPGRGWHSLRRKFASDLQTSPSRFSANWEAGRLPRRCFSVTRRPTRDSFGMHWKLVGDLAADIAKRRESNGWNPASESRKFNNHDQMRIHDLLPGWQVCFNWQGQRRPTSNRRHTLDSRLSPSMQRLRRPSVHHSKSYHRGVGSRNILWARSCMSAIRPASVIPRACTADGVAARRCTLPVSSASPSSTLRSMASTSMTSSGSSRADAAKPRMSERSLASSSCAPCSSTNIAITTNAERRAERSAHVPTGAWAVATTSRNAGTPWRTSQS